MHVLSVRRMFVGKQETVPPARFPGERGGSVICLAPKDGATTSVEGLYVYRSHYVQLQGRSAVWLAQAVMVGSATIRPFLFCLGGEHLDEPAFIPDEKKLVCAIVFVPCMLEKVQPFY